ncbi:MAG: Flp pilus assembly protein CpaB [Alphaproteobacteria bacterium HGW-Alphaproteobacteria-12]|nr:MAG: Flp pilus assembly protein CpaB [Alphaproteobacteria bacterium HGW-Alphaproteobacteria-12]
MNFAQRIQRNPVLLLGVGILLIVAALALIWLNLSARDAATVEAARPADGARAGSQEMVAVLVAARGISRGQALGPEDVTLRRLAAPAPSGSFATAAPALGRVATEDIRDSQIVFQDALSADPAAAGIAALVPSGQRAFAIRVVEEDIVGGFLQAGDRVDVFVTIPGTVYGGQQLGQNNVDRSKSALLLQDMQVLAVGPALSSSGTDVNSAARTVTVAAPPEALTRLALAGRLGHITLAIRNPSDRVLAPAEVVALEDLRPGATSAAPSLEAEAEAERPAGHRITIYSGANQTTVTAPR